MSVINIKKGKRVASRPPPAKQIPGGVLAISGEADEVTLTTLSNVRDTTSLPVTMATIEEAQRRLRVELTPTTQPAFADVLAARTVNEQAREIAQRAVDRIVQRALELRPVATTATLNAIKTACRREVLQALSLASLAAFDVEIVAEWGDASKLRIGLTLTPYHA